MDVIQQIGLLGSLSKLLAPSVLNTLGDFCCIRLLAMQVLIVSFIKTGSLREKPWLDLWEIRQVAALGQLVSSGKCRTGVK